jgi:hypothetical protein
MTVNDDDSTPLVLLENTMLDGYNRLMFAVVPVASKNCKFTLSGVSGTAAT